MIYGANYQSWRKESETCGGCGKEAAELVLLANGWDFKACPECVAACAAVEAEEKAAELPAFELTSPTEMPRLGPITARVIHYKSEVA